MMLTDTHFIIVAVILFAIGAAGVLIRRNMLIVLMSLELMLNAVNLSLATFARLHGNADGQILIFFSMVVAAAEVALGLAIVILLFRHKREFDLDQFNSSKG